MTCSGPSASKSEGAAEPIGLRILITNRVLANRTGTEVYVRDLARGLFARGHLPVVFSPRLGELAAEIRAQTIPVVDDLARVAGTPDVIHGHHALETMAAMLAFPRVPAVAFCHSWLGWADAPVRFPRLLHYVAVDHTCRDRLVLEHGIPEQSVHVALNAVDLSRYRPRPPLPDRAKRALVFSNSAGGRESHLDAVRRACANAGIVVDVAGSKSGNLLDRPEDVLGRYDLVFAKARAALEAMAVGSAVILCDVAGAGPMITTANIDELRPLNFGIRALRERATPEAIAREIARYDADDAAAVSRRIREVAGLDGLLDQLVALYRCAIAEQSTRTADPVAEARAASAYLQALAPKLHERDLLKMAFVRLLRTRMVGSLIRARASRERPTHWLPELLASMDRD